MDGDWHATACPMKYSVAIASRMNLWLSSYLRATAEVMCSEAWWRWKAKFPLKGRTDGWMYLLIAMRGRIWKCTGLYFMGGADNVFRIYSRELRFCYFYCPMPPSKIEVFPFSKKATVPFMKKLSNWMIEFRYHNWKVI